MNRKIAITIWDDEFSKFTEKMKENVTKLIETFKGKADTIGQQ